MYRRTGSLTDWDKIGNRPRRKKNGTAGAQSLPRAADWEGVEEIKLPPNKSPIYLKVDDDVLAWYKAKGRGYQNYINAVLRAYMEAQAKKQ